MTQIIRLCRHYATNEIFEIHTCDDCHFCFTQHFPDEKEIGRYYDTTDYISHSDTKKGIINTIYHAVRNFMLQRKAELVEKKSGITHGKILDIGSGTGYFLHVMAQKGWNVEGIEKNSGAHPLLKIFRIKDRRPYPTLHFARKQI